MVEFFSVDNQQKVRSRKRDVLNVSEANEILYDDFRQLLFRTEHRIYLDFNPSDINTWIKTELEDKRMPKYGDVEVIQSSYKDNPFLSDNRIREIEMLSDEDPEYWQIFGLGEYGVVTGLIFPKMGIVGRVPDLARRVGDGLDFGFTVDPTASYDLFIWQNNLYFDELLYETRLTTPDISTRWLEMGKDRLAKTVADSANPMGIQELYNLGWNIFGVEKGPDSIRTGIDILKRYNLYATARSTGIIKEQKLYKWQVDKEGRTLNKPIDRFNHAWDAVRYIGTELGVQYNEGNVLVG
jgi:phage terminase large subunit